MSAVKSENPNQVSTKARTKDGRVRLGCAILIPILAAIISVLLYVFILRDANRQIQAEEELLYSSDYVALRDAGRKMIAGVENKGKVLDVRFDDAKYDELIPASVQRLHPHRIYVTHERCTICLVILPRRYVFIFPDGSPQYGTTRLVDGVWLSTNPARDSEEFRRGASGSH